MRSTLKCVARSALDHLDTEIIIFAPIYFVLSFINLRVKLALTPSWFEGSLVQQHSLLMQFQYFNPEQSRIMQFLVPEAIHRLFSASITYSYIAQRWFFVFVAFLLFHEYMRKWFDTAAAFSGVAFMAAIMPLTYLDHLQESAPLLLVMFLLALWFIRDDRPVALVVAMVVGTLNNETMLILPLVFFLYNLDGWSVGRILTTLRKATLVALPSYAAFGLIRYIGRSTPDLVPLYQLPYNLTLLAKNLRVSPMVFYRAGFFYPMMLFGAVWVYAALRLKEKPKFLRRAAPVVPAFVLIHLLFARFDEARLMMPLSFLVIPMALSFIYRRKKAETAPSARLIAVPNGGHHASSERS